MKRLLPYMTSQVSYLTSRLLYLTTFLLFFACKAQQKAVTVTPTLSDSIITNIQKAVTPETKQPVHSDKKKLLLSVHSGSFQSFINACILSGDTGVIDKEANVIVTVQVNGSIALISPNKSVVTIQGTGFLLGTGNHYFEGFDIMQSQNATAFKTVIQKNILWKNTLSFINVTGGSYAYYSDRGGNENYTDTTIIENCTFNVSRNGVVVYSQDGAYKALHEKNVFISTDSSHNQYIHPNISIRFENVHSVKGGTTIQQGSNALAPGLALHHFSGGGVPGKAKYVELTKCVTEAKGGMWQIEQPENRSVMMEDCDIAVYSIPQPLTYARNCHFKSGGQGAFLKGTFINCSGEIWPVGGSVIEGGNFENMTLNAGKIEVNNCSVKYLSSKQNGLNTTFNNCKIETAFIQHGGSLTFDKTKQPKWVNPSAVKVVVK